ncbi:hypothetical protein IOC57_23260 [Bacillus sp. SD075]|nr:hypothetical protein [Bacillus sp. SD075]
MSKKRNSTLRNWEGYSHPIGSPLDSLHELYERFYAGNHIRASANQYNEADQASFTDPIWRVLNERSN